MARVMAMILAGGEGRRLFPLTLHRSKPSVPFGGKYRIIDFVLSNFINSNFTKIYVLTQFKSDSLNDHLSKTYLLNPSMGQFVKSVPAQMRIGKGWYSGSADAVYQALNSVADNRPDYICVFGGDHVYKMDVRQFVNNHIESKADISVAAIPSDPVTAKSFGVIEIDDKWNMVGFAEKPENPEIFRDNPPACLCSAGNYVFSTGPLIKALMEDAKNTYSSHDFGRDIIPAFLRRDSVNVYNFEENKIAGEENKPVYWRDIGSIDSYYEASMDLVSIDPLLDLYNNFWRIRSAPVNLPPAKFVHGNLEENRVGCAIDSILCDGVIISGGRVERSILGPDVRVNSYTNVDESIIMDGVIIGRYCKIKRAIIDKFVDIPPETVIGYNPEEDKKKYFVSPGGIVVIPKARGSVEDLLEIYNIK